MSHLCRLKGDSIRVPDTARPWIAIGYIQDVGERGGKKKSIYHTVDEWHGLTMLESCENSYFESQINDGDGDG